MSAKERAKALRRALERTPGLYPTPDQLALIEYAAQRWLTMLELLAVYEEDE